ncbi:MAG TPA: amidohydrolase [Vicinamibacteria bacterium]|nr:amidohydrolase [Vicinamibacteria bacterium]
MLDSFFFNGKLLTQDENRPTAEALAVKGGRIHAVGSRDELEGLVGPETVRLDLEGGTLLPGFNDSHVHVWKIGQLLTSILDLRSIGSLPELAAMLRRRDRELSPGQWLLGRGYNEARLSEGRQPTRRDLDEAVSRRPIALTRTCGHMLVASSRGLEIAGVTRDTSDPPGGTIVRDASGEPTGLLQETAMGFVKAVLPEPTPAEYAEMIRAAQAGQLSKGITSATEAGAYPDLVSAYRELERAGELRLRANVMAMRLADEEVKPLPLPERFVSDFLRVDSVKLFADGGLSGATAALRGTYRHEPTHGLLRARTDELLALALEAQEAGLRVCCHAIGDAAIDTVLDAYERLGRPGHRVEHFGLPDDSQIARARRLGVAVAPQSVFIHDLGPNFRRYLGEEYLNRLYPIRSMLRAGLVVALGSDAPVVPDDNPLLGIRAAVTRRDVEGTIIAPQESITAKEGIDAYTMGSAKASGDASDRGSLEPGKWADLVLLDRDPLETPPEELADLRVLATFVGGEERYRA